MARLGSEERRKRTRRARTTFPGVLYLPGRASWNWSAANAWAATRPLIIIIISNSRSVRRSTVTGQDAQIRQFGGSRNFGLTYTEDIQGGRTTKRDRLNICVICRRIRNSSRKLHSLRKHVWVLVIYSFYFLLFGDPFFTRFSNHRYLVRRSDESNFFRSELSFGRKLNAVIASRNAKLETNRMSRGNCTPLEWIWVAEKKLRDTRLRILPIHILPWVSKFSEFAGWRCYLVGSSIPRVFRWLHR